MLVVYANVSIRGVIAQLDLSATSISCETCEQIVLDCFEVPVYLTVGCGLVPAQSHIVDSMFDYGCEHFLLSSHNTLKQALN